MRSLPLPFAFLTLATLFVPATGCVADPEPEVHAPDTVIVNARVIDGTAAPAKMVAVRIRGDRIAEVGEVRLAPSDRLVDAGGKVLAPGFIDTHSHAGGGLRREPEALAAVSQGITTVVVGQDGGSTYPLEDFFARLEQAPAAINVASYTGHGTLRRIVLDEKSVSLGMPRYETRMLDGQTSRWTMPRGCPS